MNDVLKNLIRQAIHFIGLSGIGWLMDFIIYTLLSTFISANLFLDNVCSSIIGASFVFIFSTRYVFKNTNYIPLKIKYMLYIFYQIVLICLISKLLTWVNAFILFYFSWKIILEFSTILSKIIVTPITMILNFFVMKGITEKI